MQDIMGIAHYASGETEIFTDSAKFIETVREELPTRSTTGFTYKMVNADPSTRKAIDDLIYNEYGEENPHDLSYYRNTEGGKEPLTTEERNTALYQKMFTEQETYRDWLLTQTPEEILHHSYEYMVREDILLALEDNNLEDAQVEALYQSPSPLGDVLREFEKRETGHMEEVLDCMMYRANDIIRAEQEKRLELLQLPVYPYPASYAQEHGELEQYRTSRKANIACRDAIDNAISENYRNNRLGEKAVGQVLEQFGYDRTLYVLANTVGQKDRDGRISHDNKDWAKTIPVYEDTDSWGQDRNREFVVDRAHPGLLDLFISQARHDYLLTQPLTKEDIHQEAVRLLEHLQEPERPNSPNGTHFVAQISPDFLGRASSKDQDKLFSMLPFSSLTFSGLEGRKGVYVLISQAENRNKPLRKPSVRKKLEKVNDEPKPPAAKKRGPER